MSKIIKSSQVVEITKEREEVPQAQLEEDRGLDKSLLEEEILLEARSQAQEIIILAKYDAEGIIRDAKNQALVAREKHKAAAYKEGYEEASIKGYKDAYEKGEEEANKIIREALEIKDFYLAERQRVLNNLESEIIDLVIEIYEKVIGSQLEDEATIVELVANGIKNLDPTEKLTIIVSKEDYDSLRENKDRILAEASLINQLDIKYDINFSRGDCILETEKGSIDISVREQLEEVRLLLEKILNNE